jgi:hypothetical protein
MRGLCVVMSSVILVLKRWRQEDCGFEASLGYIAQVLSPKSQGLGIHALGSVSSTEL